MVTGWSRWRPDEVDAGGTDVDDSTRLQVDSLHETARRQQARWQWAAARDTLRRAVRVAREADRADGVALLSTERMLAEALRELGDLREAQRLASALVPRCERLLGHGHPGTVRARAVLATIAYDLGDHDTADRLCRQVIESGKGTEGPAARAILLTRANLARLYRDRGEPQLALATLQAAHGAFRRRYGDEDLDTLRMAADLAGMHLASGDRAAARQLLTRAHHRVRALLGGDHPFTVRLEERLAEVEPPMPTPPEPDGERGAPRLLRRVVESRIRRRVTRRGRQADERTPDRGLAEHALAQQALAEHELAQHVLMRQALARQAAEQETVEQETAWRAPAEPEAAQQPLAQQSLAQKPLAQRGLAQRSRRECLSVALRRHKNPLLAAALAVVVVAGICFAAVETPAAVRGLRRAGRSLGLRTPESSPASAAAPADLALADHGHTITIGWKDPSRGAATVVVSLSKNGEPVGSAVTLARGTTSYTAGGLDPSADYCFLVALLAPDATSARPATVCTTRHATTGPAPAWPRNVPPSTARPGPAIAPASSGR